MPFRQKLLLGILAALILYYVITTFVMSPAKTPVRQASQLVQPNAPQVQNEPQRPVRQPNPQMAKKSGAVNFSSAMSADALKEWGPRDPFYRQRTSITSVPVMDSSNKELGLTLRGIQWSRGEALILINNEILRINDAINGMRIVNAGEDYVVLQKGTNQITLRMGGKNE